MWMTERGGKRRETKEAARVGSVTLPGDPAGAVLDGERRELPVFGPGGYVWRPVQGQQVLVITAGPDGEQPCVAGMRDGIEWALAPGEVLIYSGGASILLRNDGLISILGTVLINGKAVMVEEG